MDAIFSESGFIVIFSSPSCDYLNDGISWTVQTKMNLKLILYDTEKRAYKVKNAKSDSGEIVMRRQTWNVSDGSGWYRNEYKLFQEEIVYRRNLDGSMSTDLKRILNKYPVVVHYFKKKGSFSIPRKKQKIGSDDYQDTIPLNVSDNVFDTQDDVFYHDQGMLSILSCAPNTGFTEEYTKVIVVLDSKYDLKKDTYHCYFNGTELNIKILTSNVLEFVVPPNPTAGIIQWYLICKLENNLTEVSPQMMFYYLPSDTRGELSLAFSLIRPYQNEIVLSKFKYIITNLDLSYNNLNSLHFIREFKFLETLTVDNNNLTEWTDIPLFPGLINLSINTNLIATIELFCDQLTKSCPKLRLLSMLGNDACPIFSLLPHHYYNFRIYVISRLEELQVLDSSTVTDEERKHASYISNSLSLQYDQNE